MLKTNDLLFLFSFTVIAFAVRFWGLSAASLRLDETQSVWQASHSIDFIIQYMLKNVHLPLHNTLLHYWMQVFGSSAASVRMLALIPGVLVIPFIYFLSIEIIGKEKSIYTTILATFSPIWIWYSKEIRMYTLLILITTASYLFFIRILKKGKLSDYVFYIIFNIIGIYTHYFFFLILGVQVLYYLIMFKEFIPKNGFYQIPHWRRFLNFVLCAELVLLVFFPWIKSVYLNHGSDTYAPVLVEPTPFNIILTYFEFISGYVPDYFSAVALSLWPLFILLGFIFLTKRQNPFSPTFLLAALGATLPILIGYTVSVLIRPIYLSRYFITVTPMLYILIAWYISELRGAIKYLLIILIFGWIGISFYLQHTSPDNPARENYSEAINYIATESNSRDVVLLAPAYTIYPFQYYYQR